MTSRIGQPDTQADLEVRACLDKTPPSSFVMVAGAGSGKTTSLVKALAHLGQTRRTELKTHNQQVACITYTEVAVNEIWGDVGHDSLFHVSTIHSFLWIVIRPFQFDLKTWVLARINEKITEAQEHHDKPRTREATRERLLQDIARYQRQLEVVQHLTHFTYGAGSDFNRGVLGHSDVINAAVTLIEQSQLLRGIIASRYPVIFVDESQDTRSDIVAAFRNIAETTEVKFCLGFFGDPMQKIYMDGAGAIDIPVNWTQITKPENFRCPLRVLKVVNAVRQPGDGLEQTRGRVSEVDGVLVPIEGSARIFLLSADNNRSEKMVKVREWLRLVNNDELWRSDDRAADVRALVVVHRMAATRLGFPNLYSALNDNAPSSLKEGLKDGTSWPLRPFITYLLPLTLAVHQNRKFDVMSILRTNCPILSSTNLSSANTADILLKLQTSTLELARLMRSRDATIRDALNFAFNAGILQLEEAWQKYLGSNSESLETDSNDSEIPSVIAFLDCNINELTGYRHYLEDLSPFATQQGVKGAEFERVMVLIDDEEGQSQKQFSYGKYFGITELSDNDNQNIAIGKDSVIERTRRLFYVCCSRATRDLAVIMFVTDIEVAKELVQQSGLFESKDIIDEATIDATLSSNSVRSDGWH
ncbi:UvrD-helicase domain-containing protein [Shewanella xiamenensis]|uniref:UvrD-helicase domain-containing protein n=1 Tax=Shewanella xiamenensis TaxID=332186 RepID=UPI00255A9B75|nr:UvrD-helicase domain-containing protein [Shewanella xiamenensis]MDL3985896.1 UvrD-helicase domain-containing protein [Shewanella xiamenensis]